jgi:predicted oxidoreductase
MASVDWSGLAAAYLKLGAGAAGTSGELLASIGAAVQSAMELYLSRTLDVRTYTAETYNGNGQSALFLRHDPIQSVTAVTVDGTAITDWVINGSASALVRPLDYWPDGIGNVTVTYTAGLESPDGVPPALLQAGVSWIAVLWKDRDRAGINSESVAGQSVTFTRAMPAFVKMTLDMFKRGYVPTC